MLRLDGISLKRDTWVLKDISLKFDPGKIYGVIGKSGAGKTTLLRIASGLLDADEGVVKFHNNEIAGPSRKLVPGYEEIQLVNQDFELDLYHTVEENIREKVLSRHKEDQIELINEFITLVELGHLSGTQARYLSGGEQQRLALARALAVEPELLLLDEPFVHLDQRLRWKVLNFLSAENKSRGLTIILVSHDGSEMMGFVHEVIYIDKAKVVRQEDAADLYYNPLTKEEAELMGLINMVKIDGEDLLFRPNEYRIDPHGNLKLSFKDAVDTGVVWLNYFLSDNKESVVLYADRKLSEVNSVSINKR